MIKNYLKNEFSNFNKSMVANFKTLFAPIKFNLLAILDWLWMIVKVVIVLFGLITVIGIVQKPGKDANVIYTLQSNHEQMIKDTLK